MNPVNMVAVKRLNTKQLDKLSDIFADLGLLGIASVIIPALFDRFNPITVLIGICITFACWIISLMLRR